MNSQETVISGGELLDPASGLSGEFDILLEGETIKAIDKPGSFANRQSAFKIDARKKLVTPGLIDIHTHLREPGFEWKETIATGSAAALAGGFTAVCCMPNTDPTNDTETVTKTILLQAKRADGCRVYPFGAISRGLKGKEMAPFVELWEAGCVAFSDDGKGLECPTLMRRALEYAKIIGAVIAVHEECPSLAKDFAMNEGVHSVKLGLIGMPGAAEDVMIARDIELAKLTGSPVHFCHVSTARGATLIKRAKEDGIPVTAEVAPHHFTLTEQAVGDYDSQAKMNPPLRTAADVEALTSALESGVIDCIASDHAPHEFDSKHREFSLCSNGLIGLQSTVPLTLAKVRAGKLSLKRAIEALTSAPARCIKLPSAALKAGAPADITILDLQRKVKYDAQYIRSKSKNTPFYGRELQGIAVMTFVAGRKLYDIDSANSD